MLSNQPSGFGLGADYGNLGTSDKSIKTANEPQGKPVYFGNKGGDYNLDKYNKSDN